MSRKRFLMLCALMIAWNLCMTCMGEHLSPAASAVTGAVIGAGAFLMEGL